MKGQGTNMFYPIIKRISAIILAVVMILSISACQKTEDASTGRVPAVLTFRDPDGTIIADNSDIEKASVEKDGSEYYIAIKFNEEGTEKFAEATKRLAENQEILYVYLDDEILMSPTVQNAITNGEAMIVRGDGGYTKEEAEELVDTINYGRKVSEAVTQSKADKTTSDDNETLPFMTTKYTFTELIPPKYDEIQDFKDGLAKVRLGDKYGFIDENGIEITSIKYDEIQNFYEGLASVRVGDKWGFIDESCKEAIPLKYDGVGSFSDGLCFVRINNNEFFIDNKGIEAIKLTDFSTYYPFSEGYATIIKSSDDFSTIKYGIIDKKGDIVFPCNFDYISYYEDGNFIISYNNTAEQFKSTGIYTRSGIIDVNGNIILQAEYLNIGKHTNGYAIVSKIVSKGITKFGFIDTRCKEIIPVIYDSAEDFDSDGYAIVSLNKKRGVIDKTGQEVVPLIYDTMGDFNSDGYSIVSINKQFGVIDKTGQEVIPLIYDEIYNLVDGIATVELDGKVGFVDTNGKEITPLIYDELDNYNDKYICKYSNDLAPVKLDGKYGFINKSGIEIIPFKYDYVYSDFDKYTGLAKVGIGLECGFIDKTGKEVIPIKYRYKLNSFRNDASFKDGITGMIQDNHIGFIDLNGNELTEFEWNGYSLSTGADGIIKVSYGYYHEKSKVGLLKYSKTMVPINPLGGAVSIKANRMTAPFQMDSQYAERFYSSYESLKSELGSLDYSASHNTYFDVWIPNTQVCYEINSQDGTLSDDDVVTYIQAPLGVFFPDMPESLSVYDFTNNLKNPYGSSNSATIKRGGGTAYFVSDQYAVVNFSWKDDYDSGKGLQLEIAFSGNYTEDIDEAIVTRDSLAWLKIVAG
jgi:hypothetical protein